MRLLHLGPVRVDLGARRVIRPDGEEHRLTPTEHALFVYLWKAGGRAVEQAELLREVWGYPSQNTRTLATTVRRLRVKIEPDPDDASVLLTVPRVGYRLDLPEEPSDSRDIDPVPAERESQVQAALASLPESRWVTFTGPPGSGKSTVAACVAGRVDAVALEAGADVLWSLTNAMGWALAEPTVDRVADLVRDAGPLVVFLDDADDQEAADLVALSTACPQLSWLCSRRRAFGAAQETAIPVGPLSESAARALLGDPPEAARITAAVDRLPLPLELVKAWIPVLGAEAVADQLESGDPLVGLERPGPARHRDLDALVDSSLARLSDTALRTLRALCVFAGPTRLSDLQAIAPDCIPTLPQLVGPGLVMRDGSAFRPLSAVRLRLCRDWDALAEPRRAHRERFAALGTREAIEAARAAAAPSAVRALSEARAELEQAFSAGDVHAPSIALALATAAELGGGQARAIDPLVLARRETPELDAAMDARLLVALARTARPIGRSRWALQQLDHAFAPGSVSEIELAPQARAELGHARALLLRGLGDGQGAIVELDRVQPFAPVGSEVQALIHGSLGVLCSVTGDVGRATVEVGRALELHASRADRRHLAGVLIRSAVLEHQAGRDWFPTLEQARELAEAIGTTELLAQVAAGHAMLCAWSEDSPGAVARYADAAAMFRELGAEEQRSRMELSGAAVLLNLDRDDEAVALAGSALSGVRQRGDRQAEAQALFILGVVAMRSERWADALACLEPAMDLAFSTALREQLEERIVACRAALR
jgi:DNA-binding winged helix-turn-helix (wHTH) protein/tetratricopeptide (TPR) repeat protein